MSLVLTASEMIQNMLMCPSSITRDTGLLIRMAGQRSLSPERVITEGQGYIPTVRKG